MRRRLLLALIATTFVLAGCGASGGDEASPTTKAPSGSDPSTTTADGGDGDEGDAPPSEFTVAQLEEILPTAGDIGPAYTLKDTSIPGEDDDEDEDDGEEEEEDPTDAAMKEQCPKAAELDFLFAEDEVDDELKIEFETERDQGIEVTLDPTIGSMTEENVAKVIDAFNDCGTVTIDDTDAGSMTMELAAEPLEGYGDYGADITMHAEFQMFGQALTIDFRGFLFVVDGVAVSVSASSGLDDATMEVVDGDVDLLPDLAAEMQERVESL